ncbi:unnamed protein product [Nippostrongylus brasiliensis]|uniref:Rab11 family-interacting protein 4A n=1 Tax=Nippostrongylus brasiliensis TaxID=27835 RepID=A0A158R193_NIPBR|nr:unnamed protein product [Nippostrongylus brasiliensis]
MDRSAQYLSQKFAEAVAAAQQDVHFDEIDCLPHLMEAFSCRVCTKIYLHSEVVDWVAKRSSAAFPAPSLMADTCSGFESQNYLKDRCRKCFRQKDKHDNPPHLAPTKKERRRSWREKISDNGGPEEDDVGDQLSVSSYLSATSKGLSSVKSCDSVNDTRSMVTAVSGSVGDDVRVMTPTEDDHTVIISMKEEIRKLKEANKKLKEEKEKYARQYISEDRPKEQSEQSLVAMLEERLNEAENSIQDYRDENTVLKCELRDLQETTYANSDARLKEKITSTEALCDELMEENETLKAEVRELQREIEEMQDQYREEEIEEFRELQRELEQNAKNCRVLQFKLRKAERLKEQTDAEKLQLQTRLNDLLGSSPEENAISTRSDSVRIKELESELRIAKEVSVRLHTELEQTEEKRYKLEDEVFCMKEKVRELQTQHKWREARNRTDVAMKRLSAELSTAAVIPEGEVSKELRDALEREIDSREQLKFAEEDLKRTQQRLKEVESENEILMKKLSKTAKLRPPMVRSASEGNAHLQLELAEHEVEHLSTKVERLERTNDHLTKKILELETDYSKRPDIPGTRFNSSEFNLTQEMEKDMGKMIATINDLERKNHELNLHLKNYENKGVVSTPSDGTDLRNEQERTRALESEITELKQTLLKSDNQKVIALATKIEQLNNQCALLSERCNNLHKKALKNGNGEAYADELKKKIEQLEKEVSEHKAAALISDLQGKGTSPEEDERRRSLSKDCSATIIAELANLLNELKSVHTLMDSIKESNPSFVRRSPPREQGPPQASKCGKCAELQKAMDEQQNEVVFYKKKNKDLTNQILQTEDRWTIEIEKQRQIFENEIKSLGCRLTDCKRQVEEQTQMLQSKSFTLAEKTRALEEQEERCNRLQNDLEAQKKEKQELEQNHKSVREYEIKYKKLESIFDQEREKMNCERSRAKNEITTLKKMADDAEELLKKSTQDLKKKESAWKTEKAALEKEVASLKKQLSSCKDEEGKESEDKASLPNSDTEETSSIVRNESDRMHLIDLKKQLAIYEKKFNDGQAQLEDLKIVNADLLDQLQRTKQGWQKDKEAHQHKTRQTEKIRMVEMDALQQKFSSRMRIMEDTNKSLHSQLVLARRERDTQKEALATFERKVLEDRKENDLRDKEITEAQEKLKTMQKALADVQAELERANTDLRITKEARKADQILWKIDRARGRNENLSEEDLRAVDQLQSQFRDCEKFYTKETERLNEKLRSMSKELQQQRSAHDRIITELREQVRVLEIEQRNLNQKKDSQVAASEVLEAGAARLQQVVHLNELQRLTRKYRLSSIIDQLQFVTDPIRRNGRSDLDANPDGIRYIINQLIAIRDEDAQTILPGEGRCPSAQPSLDRNGYAPSISECEGTYDNISQSSMSIRSVASMPVHMGGDRGGYSRNGRVVMRRNNQNADLLSVDRMTDQCDESLHESVKDLDSYKKTEGPYSSRNLPRTSSCDGTNNNGMYNSTSLKTGTNILCRVRREELARGGQPSVRLMARAFEAIDNCPAEKQGFFSIRKSRSVETAQDRLQNKTEPHASYIIKQSSTGEVKTEEESVYATLPRGGRNPFKNMGSKLVERVRRSLSRSSRQGSECPDTKDTKIDGNPTKTEKSTASLKKTKKRSAEAKARKVTEN